MGCDIHAFIEYKRKDGNDWFNFGSQFYLSRNYSIFANLAGVRSYNDEIGNGIAGGRGIPENISWETQDYYWCGIVEKDEDVDRLRSVLKSKAEQWVKSKSSIYKDDKKLYVSNPDAHSMSWCTSKELKQAIENAGGAHVDWLAFSSAISELEKTQDVRVVFWFDN